jgi:Excalibur calcium-binding domain
VKVVLLLFLVTGALCALGAMPASAAARDYDCADFANQAEAQENLLPGDPYRLDGDSDGVACEDLPCPCSYGTSGGGGGGSVEPAPPPPPPPYRLTKAAARHAAVRLARRFTRRSAQVTRLAMGGCTRAGERRINCFAIARGETSTSRTTCHLRINVRAVNRHPKASLVSTGCRTRLKLKLTAAEAAAAMRARGAEIAGKAVVVGFLERGSSLSFLGSAEWTQRSSTTMLREECFALMEAHLTPSRQVRVVVMETGCSPAPAP